MARFLQVAMRDYGQRILIHISGPPSLVGKIAEKQGAISFCPPIFFRAESSLCDMRAGAATAGSGRLKKADGGDDEAL